MEDSCQPVARNAVDVMFEIETNAQVVHDRRAEYSMYDLKQNRARSRKITLQTGFPPSARPGNGVV